MTRTPFMDCKLTSNGVVVAFWKARFVRSADQMDAHWESLVWPVPPVIEQLWQANGYATLKEVGQ